MEDITLEEAKQILDFYSKKSSNLEMQVLQLQAKLNTLNVEITSQKSKTLANENQIDRLKKENEELLATKTTTKKIEKPKIKKMEK